MQQYSSSGQQATSIVLEGLLGEGTFGKVYKGARAPAVRAAAVVCASNLPRRACRALHPWSSWLCARSLPVPTLMLGSQRRGRARLWPSRPCCCLQP
jgi:hypothetical protein